MQNPSQRVNFSLSRVYGVHSLAFRARIVFSTQPAALTQAVALSVQICVSSVAASFRVDLCFPLKRISLEVLSLIQSESI